MHAVPDILLTVLRTIFFPSHWLLSHITIVETMDSGERGMNLVALSSIHERNIGQDGDQTGDLLCSSYVRHRLSYGSRRCGQNVFAKLQLLSTLYISYDSLNRPKFDELVTSGERSKTPTEAFRERKFSVSNFT